MSTTSSHDEPALPPQWMSVATWPVIGLLLVLAFFAQLQRPLNNDVAWFFVVARGTVFQGGTLYRDYIEPNFPLASLSLVPAVWISEQTPLSPQEAITVYVLAVALASFMLTAAAAQKLQLAPAQQFGWRLALIAGYCFIPGFQFGQREHLVSMLMLPYLVAAANRSCGLQLPRKLAIAIGVGAGIGIGIKPVAALIVAAVEVAVFMRRRRLITVLRPEIFAIVFVLIAVAGDLFLVHRQYFSIARWVPTLYQAYDNWPLLVFTGSTFTLLFFLIRSSKPRRESSEPLLLELDWVVTAGVIGAMAALIIQLKGWPYQALPVAYFLFLLAGLPLLQRLPRLRAAQARVPLLALFTIGVWCPAVLGGSPPTRDFAALEQRIRESKGPFYVLSTDVWPAFPLALTTEHEWASRFPCLIMLPGLVAAKRDPNISQSETWFRSAVAQDFGRYRPTLVFVPLFQDQAMPAGFDVIGWFEQDAAFRREWQSYRSAGVIQNYAVYQRR